MLTKRATDTSLRSGVRSTTRAIDPSLRSGVRSTAGWPRAALLSWLCACGTPPAAPPRASPPLPPAPTAQAPTARAISPSPSPTPSPAPAAPGAAGPERAAAAPPAEPAVVFPPAGFQPLHARTAKPEDGAWAPMPEGARGGPPVLYRTTVHPHAIKPHIYVAVVAIDLRRVAVRLVAGTLEPESKAVPPEQRPGLVPEADQPDLIAVFNGGFMARHGRYGMKVDADVFLPPRPDACTAALYRDGSVRIASWPDLQATEPSMAAYRQTPPCLVAGGVLHPSIEDRTRPRIWSAAENGDVEIRRSALGVDASGRVLFYGLGEWVTAKELAESMKAAGALHAAQLDINWSYTKFLFFGRPAPDAPLEVVSTLIPKIKHTKRGYVGKGAERDFFYLKRRAPATPP